MLGFTVGGSKMEDFGVDSRTLCLGCECGGLSSFWRVSGMGGERWRSLQKGVGKERPTVVITKFWVEDESMRDC